MQQGIISRVRKRDLAPAVPSSLAQPGSIFLSRTKGDGITLPGGSVPGIGDLPGIQRTCPVLKAPKKRSLWALGVQDPPEVLQELLSSRNGTSAVGTRPELGVPSAQK